MTVQSKMNLNYKRLLYMLGAGICLCLVVKSSSVKLNEVENIGQTCYDYVIQNTLKGSRDQLNFENYKANACDISILCLGIRQAIQISPKLKRRFQRYLTTYKILCNNYANLNKGQIKSLLQHKSIINNFCENKVSSTNLFGFKCPDPAEIDPCSCDSTAILDCSSVGSFTEIKNIISISNFPSTNFVQFMYQPENTNLNERIFPNNTFGTLTFETITIRLSGVKEIQPAAFNGSQITLKNLFIESNENLQIFPFTSLSEFINLEVLNIIDASINSIPFLGLIPSLKIFNVISSQVVAVHHDAFTNLPAIALIDLSSNNLEELGIASGLYLASSSTHIFLDSNSLKNISNFACNQPSILDASSNSLTTFNEEVYKPLLDGGGFINVANNNINCGEFGWVTTAQKSKIISDCWTI